jgi:hypothetical protein
MDDVLGRSRTSGQAPGQSVGVLASLPASGLPGLLELNHTVPASPSHPTLHPYRAIHRAHGGPPDSVELLQCVGRTCHGLMILISDTTGKSLPGRLGVSKQCCCASRDGTRMPQSQPGRSQGGHCSERRGRMGPPAGALRATSRISQRVRRLGAALLILLMAAGVGGCGGSEEPSGTGGAPATTAAPASTAATPTTSEPVALADGRHPV